MRNCAWRVINELFDRWDYVKPTGFATLLISLQEASNCDTYMYCRTRLDPFFGNVLLLFVFCPDESFQGTAHQVKATQIETYQRKRF